MRAMALDPADTTRRKRQPVGTGVVAAGTVASEAATLLPAAPDLASMMDSLPVPVLMLDGTARIRYANSAAEPFFGMSMTQLRLLGLSELVPLDHPLFLLIEQVRSTGATIVEHELMLDGPRLHRQGITVQGAPGERRSGVRAADAA